MASLRKGMYILAVATFFLLLFAWWLMDKIATQQRQVDQLRYAVSLLIKQHPPTDEEQASYDDKWKKIWYYALPAGRYEVIFANYPQNEAFVIYYASNSKGPGAKIEFFHVTSIPDKIMNSWSSCSFEIRKQE